MAGPFRIVEVAGDEGTVAMADSKFFFWQFKQGDPRGRGDPQGKGRLPGCLHRRIQPRAGLSAEGHRRNFAEFLDALDNNRKPLIDGREARKGVEIILAIYESARTRKAVDLPLR